MTLIPYTRELGPAIDRWFDRPLFGWDNRPSQRTVLPPVESYSDEDGVVVRLEVPGIPPESLKLEVTNRILTVRAEPAEEVEKGSHGVAHRAFARSFRLPADLDADKVEARHEYGVLTVRIPKAEAAKPRTIEVSIA